MILDNLEAHLERLTKLSPADKELLRESFREDYPVVAQARDGAAVPSVDRKTLHSTYNPTAEAQKWLNGLELDRSGDTLYVVGGLGFGYHVRELLQVVPPEQVVVIEKDAAIAASALAHQQPGFFPAGLQLIAGQKPPVAYQILRRLQADGFRRFVYLNHPASTNVFPDYYNTLRGIIQVQEAASHGGYKVLLVSPLYGGSLPVTHYVKRALENLGHRCELLDNTAFYPGYQHLQELTPNKQHTAQLEGLLTTLAAETVTAKALEVRADLVLVMAQGPVTPEVLNELRNADIRTAFWFVEDGSALQYWKAIAAHFDGFFVIQKGDFLKQLQSVGCQNPYYLPMAADPFVHRPLMLSAEELEEYGSDLSHVGAGYFNRREFFAGLLDLDFKIWGSDWEKAGVLDQALQRDGERISPEETVKIFNATRINVNLHSSTYHSGVNPFGDFLNPRTFEIAACGAFQLVDERAYLAENFDLGAEIVSFCDLNEMREHAREYLQRPDDRAAIAAAARQRVLREHTYDHRVLEALGVIAGRYPDWVPRGGGLPTAEELIQEAGVDSELAQVMERFVGRGPLTLEDVASDIERGEGNLNRTEAMILLLNEFRRWGMEKGVM